MKQGKITEEIQVAEVQHSMRWTLHKLLSCNVTLVELHIWSQIIPETGPLRYDPPGQHGRLNEIFLADKNNVHLNSHSMDIKVSVVLDLLDTRKKIEIKKTEKNDEKNKNRNRSFIERKVYVTALMLIPR